MLRMGRIDSELGFTPGVYESMSKKAPVNTHGKRYTQHMGQEDITKPSHRLLMQHPSANE